MIRLLAPASINGRIVPAGQCVQLGAIEAKYIAAGTGECVNPSHEQVEEVPQESVDETIEQVEEEPADTPKPFGRRGRKAKETD